MNDDISDQVSLRGTVIIIANHGERIDIPTGGIMVMVTMLVMVMMVVSMMMTVMVMVMARIIAENIEYAIWMKLNSHVKVLC